MRLKHTEDLLFAMGIEKKNVFFRVSDLLVVREGAKLGFEPPSGERAHNWVSNLMAVRGRKQKSKNRT